MATKRTTNQKKATVRFIALGYVSCASKQLKSIRRKTSDIEIQLRIDRALASLWSLEHSIRDNNYESWKTSEKEEN